MAGVFTMVDLQLAAHDRMVRNAIISGMNANMQYTNGNSMGLVHIDRGRNTYPPPTPAARVSSSHKRHDCGEGGRGFVCASIPFPSRHLLLIYEDSPLTGRQ